MAIRSSKVPKCQLVTQGCLFQADKILGTIFLICLSTINVFYYFNLPISIPHENVVEYTVQCSHHKIRQAHIDDEYVGYSAHITVG